MSNINTSGCQQIVHNHNLLTLLYRVLLYFDNVLKDASFIQIRNSAYAVDTTHLAIFLDVLDRQTLPRKLPFLSDRNKRKLQTTGQAWTEEEAASLESYDYFHTAAVFSDVLCQHIYQVTKQRWIATHRKYISAKC